MGRCVPTSWLGYWVFDGRRPDIFWISCSFTLGIVLFVVFRSWSTGGERHGFPPESTHLWVSPIIYTHSKYYKMLWIKPTTKWTTIQYSLYFWGGKKINRSTSKNTTTGPFLQMAEHSCFPTLGIRAFMDWSTHGCRRYVKETIKVWGLNVELDWRQMAADCNTNANKCN